ncbi:MAG TPA: FkbM family methyltransferase, partial [Pyrinomonadaceae bacterium]|nr:FkbM family methyltransferase [Pyrinomonadaceae bacterium]
STYLREAGDEDALNVLDEGELGLLMDEHFRAESYTCPLVTLSDIISEHRVERIDLLKVDVEKSEFDVLSGLRDEDWKKIRQLVVEVDTPELLRQITALLERQGFDFEVDETIRAGGDAGGPGFRFYMLYARQPGFEDRVADGAARSKEDEGVAGESRGGGRALTAGELRRFLREHLPEYMIPSAFTFLPELPLTPNGKVNRRALPDPSGEALESEAAYVAPETSAEQTVAAVWREVLKVERVGVNDNFFEAGGTSLLVVQVNAKLREAFDRPIPVVEMFRHPTIKTLAAYIEREQHEKPTFERAQSRVTKQAEASSLARQMRQARQASARKDKDKKRPPPTRTS